MKQSALPMSEREEGWFGSPFDPVLTGVAQGLAALFPPIENARPPTQERLAGRSPESEDEGAGE